MGHAHQVVSGGGCLFGHRRRDSFCVVTGVKTTAPDPGNCRQVGLLILIHRIDKRVQFGRAHMTLPGLVDDLNDFARADFQHCPALLILLR